MSDNFENNEIIEKEEPSQGSPDSAESSGGKKLSRWSYQRHIVQCPLCGKDILDHMTTCPHCKAEITIGGVKPMNEDSVQKVKLIALIVGIIIALVIIVPILMKRFGG